MERILRQAARITQFIFFIFLVYFAIRLLLYHFNLVTFPYSSSLREGAMMLSTQALVKGINPFDMSLQPQLMNQYGIVYPLLAWPWAKLFGTSIIIHRLVSAISVLASCLLIFFVLQRMKVPVLLNSWAVLMLYSSLLYTGTSTATIDPGGTCMFFFLLTLFIPWFCNYSYRSLILSILCGLLGFYTKSYAVLGLFFMLSYLFIFISKLKAFYYALALSVLATISIILVNQTFQAYFDNCFFSHVNTEKAWATMERLYSQIMMYRQLHAPLILLVGILLMWFAYKNLRDNSWESIKSKLTAVVSSIRFNEINKPLIGLNFPLVLYAAFCSSFVLYMSLGRHNGATLWYFFQLLSPFLLVGATWLFSRYSYWPVLCIPFLVYNLFIMTADQDYKLFIKNRANWPEISNLISQHRHILNSPLIAPLMIEQNKEVTDDGQAEYFLPGGDRISWMKSFFKQDDRVSIQMTLFFENIRDKVENKAYDLIILQPSLLPMGVAEDIKRNYKYEGQVLLYAPQDRRPYAVTIWFPL